MFKLESYITPVLLNYVGKYVKNFKAEQSQVSLWGGDATFHNLDLRLGVLNKQFNLPFTFISGHIHELLIHVPWVKITSEPIVITINTIECILKLKDGSESEDDINFHPRSVADSMQEHTPSGYIKNIITKVVNNITINCNNLILKFVEEDIVLSVNIRFLSMQTVNEEWQPTFIDIHVSDMILRKMVTIEDLTLCLDRMDSSGKIDIYQDPVVYRCTMCIRWIMNYQNNILKRTSVTRFDLHCKKMEFSMTEQQIPMLLRLITLLLISQTKRTAASKKSSLSIEEGSTSSETSLKLASMDNQGWSSWAWNMVTSFVPGDWSDDSLDMEMNEIVQTLHFGVYIDDAILTFKITESTNDTFTQQKSVKPRYRPFFTLRLGKAMASVIIQGLTSTIIQLGLASVRLFPRGKCSCGHSEVQSNVESFPYISMGNSGSIDYLKNSLFDISSEENQGTIYNYSNELSDRLSATNPMNLLEKCPAFVMDYFHHIEWPEELTDDVTFINSRDFEFSNFKEIDKIHYIVGDLTVNICSGILHRLTTLTETIQSNINVFTPEKTELNANDLPPVTFEEFEALNEYIPIVKKILVVSKVVICFQVTDHHQDLEKIQNDDLKKLKNQLLDYPKVVIEIEEISCHVTSPMYAFRVVACASKQQELSKTMLDNCYTRYNIKFVAFTSRLHLTEHSQMLLVLPCNFDVSVSQLLYPQYWRNPEIIHTAQELTLDSLTVTMTKAKLMVVYSTLMSIFSSSSLATNLLVSSSLFADACSENNPIHLEFLCETISYSNVITSRIISKTLAIGSMQIFTLSDTSQAFVLCGPENTTLNIDEKLFTGVLQIPRDFQTDSELFIATFKVAETRASLDPLLIDWMNYQSVDFNWNEPRLWSNLQRADETLSDTSTKKKFPSLNENVHSPSDKLRRYSTLDWTRNRSETSKTSETRFSLYQKLIDCFPYWRRLIISGKIEPFVIYMPETTMNGIGVNGIEQAKDRALETNDSLNIIMIKTSQTIIRSISLSDHLSPHVNPATITQSINWTKFNYFPWVINLTDFHCLTVKKQDKVVFFNIDTLNATIDATVKPNVNSESALSTLGFCVYIDTSPIIISTSDDQLKLIEKLILNGLSIVNNSMKIADKRGTLMSDRMPISLQSQTPLSPTQLLYTETETTTSTTSASKNEIQSEVSESTVMAMTAWIQWTITKISLQLLTSDAANNRQFRIIVELEDIITSLDWQSVYFQIKNKITAATIFHQQRTNVEESWTMNDYSGYIMCSREENLEKMKESDFLNITITSARSNNVHTKWRGNTQKLQKEYLFSTNNSSTITSYITEIVIKIQMLEIVLPIDILQRFNFILNFLQSRKKNKIENIPLNYQLPLVYLDFQGLILVIPVILSQNYHHDTIIFKTDSISTIPHAENPICRVIYKPDIYELAAQANILNTPGSAVEDRQYQIKINGIQVLTTTWDNYEIKITKRKMHCLYTMTENPALEWNKLGNHTTDNQFSSCQLVSQFDLCCIVAPPIIFKSDIIVCGTAVELTFLTDVEFVMSLDQIKLLSVFHQKVSKLTFNMNHEDLAAYTNENMARTSVNPRIESIQETTYRVDSIQDSGIDVDMSSMDTVLPDSRTKVLSQPFEYLFNCEKIVFIFYDTENSNHDVLSTIPLMLLTINQPNAYISEQNLTYTLRVNCFDISLGLNGGTTHHRMAVIPNARNFRSHLIVETKNGDPHPNTGIPPSFLVVKWEKTPSKSHLSIEMGRPTKCNLSLSTIMEITAIQDKILNSISGNLMEKDTIETSYHDWFIKDDKISIPDIDLSTKQLVLLFREDSGTEMTGSLSELHAILSSKPRKIHTSVTINSAMVTTKINNSLRLLLNSMMCNFVINVIWESWHELRDIPFIRIQGYSDVIRVEIDKNQIQFLNHILDNYQELMDSCSSDRKEIGENLTPHMTEQHYQDDLKAGAFQFADGQFNQEPLPYQVVFYSTPRQIMAWKYPQPRVLTRLTITEVMIEIINELDIDLDTIHCTIEYWNESLMAFQQYITFNLGETDYTSKLPNKTPTRAVACLWRAVIFSATDDNCPVTARDLAGCLRIDSYFNSSLIPTMEITFNTQLIQLSLFHHINLELYKNLPQPLDKFKLNNCLPTRLNFASCHGRNIIVVYNRWDDSGILFDVILNLDMFALNYKTMAMQELMTPLETKVQISMKDDQAYVLLFCKEFSVKFGPEIAHTLLLSLNMETLENCDNCGIFADTIIANDSNIPLRFGQCHTTDDVLLQTRECHFYPWRYRYSEKLRIAINSNGWSWSRPFDVSRVGNNIVIFDRIQCGQINVTVKLLSATQKLILFSGQILISNQLTDNFEFKLIQYNIEEETRQIVSETILNVNAHTQPPSLVIQDEKTMAIRLRFLNTTNLAWTGDIPLHSNAKCDQPWLVKVPTLEKSQFLSIWVRIVQEELTETKRILVVLSPLYMIQSWLPMALDVHLETPTLHGVLSTPRINGCGERQQINCPGTFEHFHQLTFLHKNITTVSTMLSTVPLSYNYVDQRVFFKRPDRENIDSILEHLASQNNSPSWPSLSEDLTRPWTPVETLQTNVQVRYLDAGLISSTLLLEIRPWCLVFNSSGQTISLVTSENNVICNVPHGGVAAPPKMEGIFQIQLSTSDETSYKSSPLRLAHSDWNRGFIMPQINGLIPLEGTIQVSINCTTISSILIIKSTMHNEDIRILKIMSTHIVCNFTDHHLTVAAMIVNGKSSNINVPEGLESFNVPPCQTRNAGLPVYRWFNINNSQNNSSAFLTLRFETNNDTNDWSCPIKIDQSVSRNCIAISNGATTIPIVVTTQKERDMIYVCIFEDQYPQVILDNSCDFLIVAGQANETLDAIKPDAPPFSWICRVAGGKTSHYTMKSVGSRVPDALIDREMSAALMLGTYLTKDSKTLGWKKIIEFPSDRPFKFDQFVYVNGHGDVKIMTESRGNTVYIHLQPKSQIEISVSDIRSRLMLEGIKIYHQKPSIIMSTVEKTFLKSSKICENNDLTISNNTKLSNKNITIYFNKTNLIITQNDDDNAKQSVEVAGFYLINTIISLNSTIKNLNAKILIGDLQLDNQMFDSGGFDFPVVLISQKPPTIDKTTFNSLFSLENTTKEIAKNSFIVLEGNWDKIDNLQHICTDVYIKIDPINIYIEDKFVTQLLDYTSLVFRPYLRMPLNNLKPVAPEIYVNIPANVVLDATIMSCPLQLHRLTIEPISILLSVHTSVRLYVALDHSPLHFGIFQRRNLITTPYRLGNALTMHYLSGAIFGAGWVVGSLEILGSPGSFAQALGSGLKDFIALPFQGLLQGPWGFINGISHGSASLMKNITAGTVNSVTKLASSVARNLDRLTLDEEHVQRQEESRRLRPQGMVQGLYQGLTGFGISVIAAVAGLAHHPLQHVWSGEATTKGVVTGVGLGLVGVVTKPLSGAAELVALTGQGLLHRTGWNSLPQSRQTPYKIDGNQVNTCNRYIWKLMPYLIKSHDEILHLVDGTLVTNSNFIPITLVLTRQNFLIINNREDSVDKILALRELSCQSDLNDSSILRLSWPIVVKQKERPSSPERFEMDEDMRCRIEQYVINSTAGYSNNLSSVENDTQLSSNLTSQQIASNTIEFYIDTNQRNYLINIVRIVKRQNQGLDFNLL